MHVLTDKSPLFILGGNNYCDPPPFPSIRLSGQLVVRHSSLELSMEQTWSNSAQPVLQGQFLVTNLEKWIFSLYEKYVFQILEKNWLLA